MANEFVGNLSQTIAYAATIPIIIFLIFLLLSLYRLTRDRIALYILFSKTCFNIVEMSLVSAYVITNYCILPSRLPDSITKIYSFAMQSAMFTTFVHFLALAINRFHAVFMPFSYMRVWKKRNTHLYILFVSFIGISLGSIFMGTYTLIGSTIILNIVQYTVLSISGFIYSAMIFKFTYEFFVSKNHQNSLNTNLEKDRILLSAIALISILPLPFSLFISYQQKFYDMNSVTGMILHILRITNYAIMQCIRGNLLDYILRGFSQTHSKTIFIFV